MSRNCRKIQGGTPQETSSGGEKESKA